MQAPLLRQLAVANQSLGGGRIGVVAEREVDQMELDIKSQNIDMLGTTVDYYSGSRLDSEVLHKVNWVYYDCWRRPSARPCILAVEEFHISHPIYMFCIINSGFVLTKFWLVRLLQTSISNASSIIILAEGQVADEVRWYLLVYLHLWSRKQASTIM